MSLEAPLEEDQDPLPTAYKVDANEEREYLVQAVVKEKKHKRLGLRYVVRYVNDQYQWWRAADVARCFPLVVAEYKANKAAKSESRNNAAKVLAANGLNRTSSPSSSTATVDEERKLRSRKRPSSSLLLYDERSDNGFQEPTEDEILADLPGTFEIVSSHSLHETTSPSKRHKQVNEFEDLSANSENDDTMIICNGNDDLIKHEVTSEFHIPPSPTPSTPDVETHFVKKMISDPVDFSHSLAKLNEAFTKQFVEPIIQQREDDKCQIEDLTKKLQEAEDEKKELQRKITEQEVKIVSLSEQHKKELSERDDTATNLENHNTRLKREFTETLRTIVGKDRYQDTDDIATLTNLAVKRTNELDLVLEAVKTPENLAFWGKTDKKEEANGGVHNNNNEDELKK